MIASGVVREFSYHGVRLPDPDSRMSPDEVKMAFCLQYPELATASITGPESVGDKLRYTFVRAIGAKG